jgi:hypothetical protein
MFNRRTHADEAKGRPGDMKRCLAVEPEFGQDGSHVLVTTLYDLVNAVEEAIQDGEEELVLKTVLKLIDSGTARFQNV